MYFVKFTHDQVRWIGTHAQFVEFLESMHALVNVGSTAGPVSKKQLGDIFLNIIHIDISPYKSIDEMLSLQKRTSVRDNIQQALDLISADIELDEVLAKAKLSPSKDEEMPYDEDELERGMEEFLHLLQKHVAFSLD